MIITLTKNKKQNITYWVVSGDTNNGTVFSHLRLEILYSKLKLWMTRFKVLVANPCVCGKNACWCQQLMMIIIYWGVKFCAYIGSCTINNESMNFSSIWNVLYDWTNWKKKKWLVNFSHKTESTSWNHPFYLKIMEELGNFNFTYSNVLRYISQKSV